MSSVNKDIKDALKKILVPRLRAEGFTGKYPHFTGKYPHFMRRESDTLHLLSVQFDKWGDGFFLEFASHPAGDKTMSWSEVIPETKLKAAHTLANTCARLQESADGNTSDSWFRFDALNEKNGGRKWAKYMRLSPNKRVKSNSLHRRFTPPPLAAFVLQWLPRKI